jgi:hypothetical protein
MKTLVSVSVSGMGDRIRLLLAARALAPKLGREFLHVWPVNGHCGAEFTDLFKVNEPIVTPTDPWPDRGVLDLKCKPWAEVIETLEKIRDWETVKFHCYRAPFDQHDFGTNVDFSEGVWAKASQFALHMEDISKPFTHGTVGCHVRGGDYSWKTPNIEEYYAAVDTFGGGSIFLATDERWVRQAFLKHYGEERMILYEPRGYLRGDPEATIDSAVELCLLRKCGLLVLSGWSEFSRLACIHQPPAYRDGVLVVTGNY